MHTTARVDRVFIQPIATEKKHNKFHTDHRSTRGSEVRANIFLNHRIIYSFLGIKTKRSP